MPAALITGVTGQDGWYLSELLVSRGYRVVGIARRIGEVPEGVTLTLGDVRDEQVLRDFLRDVRPDEVYHLAAESSVVRSWADPDAAEAAVLDGTRVLLDACRAEVPLARVVAASSSEVFATTDLTPQNEATPLAPQSPYGRGKAKALELVRSRRASGAHLSAAILYNHESPRRPPEFLSRKVTRGAAAISLGLATELTLGALDARRDWGFSGDYVDALWRMTQQPSGSDYVIGSGVSRRVWDLCETAFAAVNLEARDFVRSDPAIVRAVDPGNLVADSGKAHRVLGWMPKTSFAAMIRDMVVADLARLSSQR